MLGLAVASIELALCRIDKISTAHTPTVVLVCVKLRHRICLLQSFTDLGNAIRIFANFIYDSSTKILVLIWLWCPLFESGIHQLN